MTQEDKLIAREVLVADIASVYLEHAREMHAVHTVADVLDVVEGILDRTGWYAEDLGTSGVELRRMRIAGHEAQAKCLYELACVGMVIEGETLDSMFHEIGREYVRAVDARRTAPRFPKLLKDGELNAAALEKHIIDNDPFAQEPRVVGFTDDGHPVLQAELLPADAEVDFSVEDHELSYADEDGWTETSALSLSGAGEPEVPAEELVDPAPDVQIDHMVECAFAKALVGANDYERVANMVGGPDWADALGIAAPSAEVQFFGEELPPEDNAPITLTRPRSTLPPVRIAIAS